MTRKGAEFMYFIISSLVEFYLGNPLNKVWLVLVFWLLWPGLMFVVGFIGESRLIPIAEHQAKAFLPGDLSLGVMAVALLSLHANTPKDPSWWGYSLLWWIAVFGTMAIVAAFIRQGDVANYPYRSGVGPTKITHDIIGYFLIPALLICLGVPQLIEGIAHGELAANLGNWAVFVSMIVFYVVCAGWDIAVGFTAEDVLIRHPENWQPIWRR